MPSTSDLDQRAALDGTADASMPVFSAAEIIADSGERLVARIRDACLETGFLIVEPTAEMQGAIAATLDRMQAFFSLDDDDRRKQDVRQADSQRGWRPRYTEPAYQPGTVASVEAFDLGVCEINADLDDGWPDIPDFRETVSRCWDSYLRLADALLERISSAAGLASDFLVSRCQSRALNSLRLLHYAGDLPAASDSHVGISAHTDFECITLLYQDAPGLELRTGDGRWLDAEVGVGRIVVMLDDMLERWTNGYFSATGHRVRRTAERRCSIVMFIAVDNGLAVAPLEQFVSHNKPPGYEPVTQADHLDAEIRRARKNTQLM